VISRRRFLAAAGVSGLGLLAGGVAACGTSPAPSSSFPPPDSAGPSGSPDLSPTPPPSGVVVASGPPGTGPVARENRLPGDAGWDVSGPVGPVAAYADRASVAPGEVLALHAAGPTANVAWYRLGWYGAVGGRRVGSAMVRPLVRATAPPRPNRMTGLVEAGWPAAVSLEVPGDWTSGLYLAVLRPLDRPVAASVVPFVVRPAQGSTPAPVLFVSAATTWQAYNGWGGKSLYGYNSRGTTTAVAGTRAAVVSFDRPYLTENGAGLLRRWELPFVRWQERHGRNVDYIADLDLARHPELLAGRRLIVFAGHHEYWSRPMRDAIAGAVAAGVNVAFLSANEVYWQARIDDSALGPLRRVTCYKSAARDPLTASQPALATCRWREPPVNEPEAPLVGQMYGHVALRPVDWVVTGSSHWLYGGTGLRDGDRIANLVGQEYDTFFPDLAPPGTRLLARSPVPVAARPTIDPGAYPSPAIQTATIYTAPSGATVFAAGTFQWSWALDPFGAPTYAGVATPLDGRVGRMTRNLFDRLGDGLD
jgi:hypothetical protein